MTAQKHNEGERELRAGLYSLFATLYAQEMPQAMLQAWLKGEAQPLLQALAQDGHAEEVAAMQASLDALRQTADARLELAADYAACFLLDLKSCAPPYASCYALTPARLYGPQEQAMREQLSTHALSVSTHFPEAADHLAVQLEFLAWLIIERKDDEASRQIDELTSWLPAFADKCAEVSTHYPFYPALARLLCRVLQQDKAACH